MATKITLLFYTGKIPSLPCILFHLLNAFYEGIFVIHWFYIKKKKCIGFLIEVKGQGLSYSNTKNTSRPVFCV